VEELRMAWTRPELLEVNCGMEINMYGPAEDEGVLF
jgi:coenzyme PQQ precursor peptide PqqA